MEVTMKILREAGMMCPFCRSRKVHIRKNASKDFQVECTKCGAHGGWYTKPQALIQWYSMGIQYWINNGMLVFPEDKKE